MFSKKKTFFPTSRHPFTNTDPPQPPRSPLRVPPRVRRPAEAGGRLEEADQQQKGDDHLNAALYRAGVVPTVHLQRLCRRLVVDALVVEGILDENGTLQQQVLVAFLGQDGVDGG